MNQIKPEGVTMDELKSMWSGAEMSVREKNPGSMLQVQYSEEYNTLFGIYTYLLNNIEHTERALIITSAVIHTNMSNSHAWWLRRQILEGMKGFDPIRELTFVIGALEIIPKIYQAWTHMWWLAQKRTPKLERAILLNVEYILEKDYNNFHAWSFLLNFAELYGMDQEVFDITTRVIERKPTINSAWAERYTLLKKGISTPSQEFNFAYPIFTDKTFNDSIPNYIIGLCELDKSIVPEAIRRTEEFMNKCPLYFNPKSLLFRLELEFGDRAKAEALIPQLETCNFNEVKALKILLQSPIVFPYSKSHD